MADASARIDNFYSALSEDDPEELYENAPCGYLSTAADGTIIKVNDTFLSWTNFERDALVGRKRFQQLLRVGDRIFYETHFAPLLRLQGRVREIAVEIVTPSGAALPVLVNAVTRGGDGEHSLITRFAIFDARERRSYEAELVAARTRAEQSEAKARALATTLQASLLPPEPPSVPGLDVAAVFRPAGDGTEVGGDFFDVFETDMRRWGIVVGDVCGKGAEAAAVTALVRYTVRAAAATTSSPTQALRAAHDALMRHRDDTFCTAVFMTIDMDDGPVATMASAGHPLPVLRRRGGDVERIGASGSILGMLEPHVTHEATVALAPADAVVLFTDGIVEARRGEEFFGEQRLEELVAKTDGDAHHLAQTISEAAVDFQAGLTRDDIAVVVVAAPAA